MYCYENTVSAKTVSSRRHLLQCCHVFSISVEVDISTNVKRCTRCPNVGSVLWPKYVLPLYLATPVKSFLYTGACYSRAPLYILCLLSKLIELLHENNVK